VWETLSDLLRANTRALADVRLVPPGVEPAYRRFDASFTLEQRARTTVPLDEGPDEVDRLFTDVS
jgi:hypothetical protein